MPTGTAFDPIHVNEFEKTKLNKSSQGVIMTATLGGTANLDLTVSDDYILAGGATVLVQNGFWGDSVDFQVLSGSTLLKQFVTSWFIDPSNVSQQVPQSYYPAKIFAGLTMRVVYHSVGSGLGIIAPSIAVNYNLEKVLV